jgi:O-antigen biosynthesis protein
VSDDVAGLREVFGSSVQVAHGPAELRRLVSEGSLDVVFGDDATRRAQAEEVHRLHSFDARATRLLDDAVRVVRERRLRRTS